MSTVSDCCLSQAILLEEFKSTFAEKVELVIHDFVIVLVAPSREGVGPDAPMKTTSLCQTKNR